MFLILRYFITQLAYLKLGNQIAVDAGSDCKSIVMQILLTLKRKHNRDLKLNTNLIHNELKERDNIMPHDYFLYIAYNVVAQNW